MSKTADFEVPPDISEEAIETMRETASAMEKAMGSPTIKAPLTVDEATAVAGRARELGEALQGKGDRTGDDVENLEDLEREHANRFESTLKAKSAALQDYVEAVAAARKKPARVTI